MRRLIALLLMVFAAPAVAQTAPAPTAATADPALTARINELVAVLSGTGDYDAYFALAFRAAVPKEKFAEVTAQVTTQLGKPLAIDSIKPASPFTAYVRVKYERGIANLQLGIDPTPPHQVAGLLMSSTEVAGDSLDKLVADFRALPGATGFGIYELGTGAPRLVAGIEPQKPVPLGSAFKLWVLGELAREVAAGDRKWSDVVPVGPASMPSGILQSWPAGSPVTLQTLASLMISISDNTATDTLVTIEGAKLDSFVAKAGAPGLAPMMTTRQMFAIKSGANADLAAQWTTSQAPSARRKLLSDNAARLASTPINPAMFAGKPLAIDTLEWFASPAQTAGVLDWMRTQGGQTALAVMAINPGTDPSTRARFDYLGFKGGLSPACSRSITW
ncbi:MAG: hypothetical protein JWO16_1767 [Sphingomonas bacterium]|nr:hypothetical protein [Sphingomonas bacterium]